MTYLPKSTLFTAIFVVTFGYLCLTGPVIPDNVFLVVLELVGIILVHWSVITLNRAGSFGFFHSPSQKATLVTHGPFAIVRHPTYTGLLLVTFVLVGGSFDWVRFSVFLTFFINMLASIEYEEKLLESGYKKYREYKKDSFKLIPYLY